MNKEYLITPKCETTKHFENFLTEITWLLHDKGFMYRKVNSDTYPHESDMGFVLIDDTLATITELGLADNTISRNYPNNPSYPTDLVDNRSRLRDLCFKLLGLDQETPVRFVLMCDTLDVLHPHDQLVLNTATRFNIPVIGCQRRGDLVNTLRNIERIVLKYDRIQSP